MKHVQNMHSPGRPSLPFKPISFGCMSLTDNSKPNQQLLRTAFDQGINLFDTADIYGDGVNEMLVGDALGPVRKEVLIATKVGNQRQPDGSLLWAPSRAYILKSVENSLKRLKTDYIDLYQLHGGTVEDPIDEIIDAFESLKKQGKIRWYGISSIRPNVIRQYVERSGIVSVMMQYNLLDHRPEEEMLDLLAAQGISVIVRGAIAGGLLIGKQSAPYLQFTESEVAKAGKAIASLGEDLRATPLKIALSYAYSHPAVGSIALGIRTQAQLAEATAVMEQLRVLNPGEQSSLRRAVRDFRYSDHR